MTIQNPGRHESINHRWVGMCFFRFWICGNSIRSIDLHRLALLCLWSPFPMDCWTRPKDCRGESKPQRIILCRSFFDFSRKFMVSQNTDCDLDLTLGRRSGPHTWQNCNHWLLYQPEFSGKLRYTESPIIGKITRLMSSPKRRIFGPQAQFVLRFLS